MLDFTSFLFHITKLMPRGLSNSPKVTVPENGGVGISTKTQLTDSWTV
jgi:hypothetical protein